MKTIFLSEKQASGNPKFLFQCPYIKFMRGKWREDILYFNDDLKIKNKKGYKIC
jgi:hypothetical protein